MVRAHKHKRTGVHRVPEAHGRRKGCREDQPPTHELYTAHMRGTAESDVEGTARFVLDRAEGTLKATIRATNLEPGECHPQAVHGISDTGPQQAEEVSGDVADRLFEFGPILLLLSPFPDADEQGTVACEYLISLREQPEALEALEPARERMVVLYGQSSEGLYEPAMPVAWGQLRKRKPVRIA